MISLKDALPVNYCDALRASKPEARSRAAARVADVKDFSHLTHANLEAEGFVDESSFYFQVKDVPMCGACDDGTVSVRPHFSVAPTSRPCHRCGTPRRWIDRLNKIKLPSTAINMSFDVYNCDSERQYRALDYYRRWIRREHNSHPPGLLMHGTSGNGKSSALYCLAREAAQHGRRVRFSTHNQIIRDIKASMSGNRNWSAERWLTGVDLLLLDEVGGMGGNANRSQWWATETGDLMDEIVSLWQSGSLAVVWTSNLNLQQIVSALNSNTALKSRLEGMFKRPIQMTGPDRRRAKVNDDWDW